VGLLARPDPGLPLLVSEPPGALRRTRVGFDTLDHELDLWSTDGRTWNRKDEELLDQRVHEGRFTADEAAAIRAEAGRLEAGLASGGRGGTGRGPAGRPIPLGRGQSFRMAGSSPEAAPP
jgi:hypothetical protein